MENRFPASFPSACRQVARQYKGVPPMRANIPPGRMAEVLSELSYGDSSCIRFKSGPPCVH